MQERKRLTDLLDENTIYQMTEELADYDKGQKHYNLFHLKRNSIHNPYLKYAAACIVMICLIVNSHTLIGYSERLYTFIRGENSQNLTIYELEEAVAFGENSEYELKEAYYSQGILNLFVICKGDGNREDAWSLKTDTQDFCKINTMEWQWKDQVPENKTMESTGDMGKENENHGYLLCLQYKNVDVSEFYELTCGQQVKAVFSLHQVKGYQETEIATGKIENYEVGIVPLADGSEHGIRYGIGIRETTGEIKEKYPCLNLYTSAIWMNEDGKMLRYAENTWLTPYYTVCCLEGEKPPVCAEVGVSLVYEENQKDIPADGSGQIRISLPVDSEKDQEQKTVVVGGVGFTYRQLTGKDQSIYLIFNGKTAIGMLENISLYDKSSVMINGNTAERSVSVEKVQQKEAVRELPDEKIEDKAVCYKVKYETDEYQEALELRVSLFSIRAAEDIIIKLSE